jgi:hypothetical protein
VKCYIPIFIFYLANESLSLGFVKEKSPGGWELISSIFKLINKNEIYLCYMTGSFDICIHFGAIKSSQLIHLSPNNYLCWEHLKSTFWTEDVAQWYSVRP